ncbi:related to epoxide hydrolase [Lecanosticta acicola]|uniref:Related to epoxide hydrolase n=1 Tax=Lecanosticta acicola TaxID=111012 RepID=A0AAI8Z4V5_9PEZI|nr:related to epoxide hydrolase [Lecanosticta acicola]
MTNQIDKLRVTGDNRYTRKSTVVNGRKWYYLDAPSSAPERGTIFLIHGFPDLSFTWRYQIPLLTSLGLHCIALDCMGYGSTGTSDSLSNFGFKAHADAIATIAQENHISHAIIGGHDWGGITVYRVAQYYPSLITHIFSVCTPFTPPVEAFIGTRELVRSGKVPQFGYQLQFGSEEGVVERAVDGDEGRMRKFLNGLYGGKTEGGKKFMDPRTGVDLGIVAKGEVERSVLMSEEEIDFYVQEFMKNGIHGPLNWYRTRKVNWEDEKSIPASLRTTIRQPVLYILATKDEVLTRDMGRNMETMCPNLTRGEVPAGHWALWQTPEQINGLLKGWVEGVVFGGKSKL